MYVSLGAISSTAAQRWVLALTSVASFMAGLDILVVTTALPTIGLHLGASVEELEWANGQPAIATYRRGADGAHHAHSVRVCTVADGGIARMVAFQEPSLFATFGLPPTFPTAPARPERRRRGSQVP
jgi:hypothetical protein